MKSVRWIGSYIFVAALGLGLAFMASSKFMAPAHSQDAPTSGEIPAEFLKEVESTQVPPPPPLPEIGTVGEGQPVGDGATVPLPETLPVGEEFGQEVLVGDGFVYDPTGKRDPFRPFKTVRPSGNGYTGKSSPAITTLEPLQRWEIERLQVVGILWDVRTPRALILDPDGAVVTVVKNSKIGRNDGFVAAIREGEVVVMETKYEEDRQVKEARVMELKK